MSRRRDKSTRAYPAAGVSVTGLASRFRTHKTTGAKRAADQGEAWEDQDRARDQRGGWRLTRWTR
ncbi:hypothetical protein ACWIID_09165 [Streptomyces phaeochromogenes]